MKKVNQENVNNLFWVIYILLLIVLLPHTAWMFSQAEPTTYWGLGIAWAAAIVFEAVIFGMTHKLANHISHTIKYTNTWKRLKTRYFNAYGAGLLLAWFVSTYANLAHAVEFGQPIKIFAEWGLPVWSYSVAFGAILPTASLLFAWVLSSVIEQDATEHIPNADLEKAKETIRELHMKLRNTEQRANQAEARFEAIGDFFSLLMTQPKKERILTIAQQRPQLNQSAIAIITETSPAYVSEVLNDLSTH